MKRKIYMTTGIIMSVLILATAFYTGGRWFDHSSNQASGMGQGIKVHGWWTITVKNPDGTVAEKRQFENSLQTGGGEALADVLSNTVTPGEWVIQTDASGAPCIDSNGSTKSCNIYEQTSTDTLSKKNNSFKNLQVASANGKLTLSGYATAAQDGEIPGVSTLLYTCSNSITPANCHGDNIDFSSPTNGGSYYYFTRKGITPISVTANQQILITVVISFS